MEVGPVSGRRLRKLAGVADGSGSRSTRRSILRSPGSSASRPSADKRNRVECATANAPRSRAPPDTWCVRSWTGASLDDTAKCGRYAPAGPCPVSAPELVTWLSEAAIHARAGAAASPRLDMVQHGLLLLRTPAD